MYKKQIVDGYFIKTVTYDERLEFCPYGSCGKVYTADGDVVLVSYTTSVAGVDHNGFAWCNGTYSATTRKHIGAFAKEYGLTYQDFKAMCNGDFVMNVETGECIDTVDYLTM